MRYLAVWPDQTVLRVFLARTLEDAGVATCPVPEGLRTCRRGEVRFFFNYGPTRARIPDAATDRPFLLGEALVPPVGVAAVAEGSG